MPRKPTIALVGAGRVAQTLGPALRQAGYRLLEVVGRDGAASRARARRLARQVGARATTVAEARLHADLIWLAVSDDAVAACARELARRTRWEGKVALHSSGALPGDQLAPGHHERHRHHVPGIRSECAAAVQATDGEIFAEGADP